MRCSSAVKVLLLPKAYCQIRSGVLAVNNEFEIGGILLGYKFLNRYFIAAVTVSTEPAKRSKVSFVLDGKWHTARVKEYMQEFRCKPSILGIWHSHICDVDTFSELDRQSNRRFAETFGSILSMIVMLTMPSRDLNLTTYFIRSGRKETPCQLMSMIR